MTLTSDKQTGYQLQRAPFQKLQNNNFLNIEKKRLVPCVLRVLVLLDPLKPISEQRGPCRSCPCVHKQDCWWFWVSGRYFAHCHQFYHELTWALHALLVSPSAVRALVCLQVPGHVVHTESTSTTHWFQPRLDLSL